MKYSLKGALLSGVVFPGLGQIILKRYKRGLVLMLTVSASLIVLAIRAAQYAFTVLDKIELEGGVIDLKTITDAAAQASSTLNNLVFNLGFLLIVVCWIFGTVDAYRIGRKMDLEDSAPESRRGV